MPMAVFTMKRSLHRSGMRSISSRTTISKLAKGLSKISAAMEGSRWPCLCCWSMLVSHTPTKDGCLAPFLENQPVNEYGSCNSTLLGSYYAWLYYVVLQYLLLTDCWDSLQTQIITIININVNATRKHANHT